MIINSYNIVSTKYTNEFTLDGVVDRTARYTEYSNMPSAATCGGSHDRCAPSTDFDILMADGAPGKPGKQVLNADSYKNNWFNYRGVNYMNLRVVKL